MNWLFRIVQNYSCIYAKVELIIILNNFICCVYLFGKPYTISQVPVTQPKALVHASNWPGHLRTIQYLQLTSLCVVSIYTAISEHVDQCG